MAGDAVDMAEMEEDNLMPGLRRTQEEVTDTGSETGKA